MTMDHFAHVCDRIAAVSSRNRKIALLADFFRTLDDADLVRSVRFLSGEPVPGARLSAGGATLRDAATEATGYPAELVRLCAREVGDTSETLSLLVHNRTENVPLSFGEAEALLAALARARGGARKSALIAGWLRTYRPLTLRYLLKSITGNFRIGLQARLVEEALALSTGVPHERVRAALRRNGDLAAVAAALRSGSLEKIGSRLFQPFEFMLARPLESLPEGALDEGEWLVEDKYDGIRCQLHWADGRVRLFSRSLEDITASFPDLVAPLSGAAAPFSCPVALDGELLAWREGRALSFTVLQQRLARRRLAPGVLDKAPVAFIAYDVLAIRGEPVFHWPIEQRRAWLESAAWRPPLLLSPQRRLESPAAIERCFAEARARRNEGLLLKRAGSLYEPGRRSAAWIKVKRPFATLDVVITAAEQGHGRRATVLSDYTFAVRDGERFVNVGKAYSGLTDEEIRELTRLLRSLATQRFGRVTLVEPRVVLEVAFDGIQPSPRHKSGFALRFPRILRWRRDKTPAEADTLEHVRELYVASLGDS